MNENFHADGAAMLKSLASIPFNSNGAEELSIALALGLV